MLSAVSSTITSDDSLASVTFPAGTFSVDATCEITKDTNSLPVKSTFLIGPYAISCADENNNSLTTINHPLSVRIQLPSNRSYIAYVQSGHGWTKAKATTKNDMLSFSLTKLTSFAAAPGGTNLGPILLILGAIALLLVGSGGGLYFLIQRRRQQAEYDAYIQRRFIEGDVSATTTATPPEPAAPPTTPPAPPPPAAPPAA